MPTNRRLIIAGFLIGLVLLGSGSWAIAVRQPVRNGLQRIDHLCQKSRDQQGFGVARIGSMQITHETYEFTKPCRIHLKPGTHLTLKDVHITSRHLIIDDQPAGKQPPSALPTKVNILNASLRGPQSGLQITITTPNSQVLLEQSQLDYDASVGIGVGANDSDVFAKLTLDGNTISSTGPDSEGVVISTTGHGWYVRNVFSLAPHIGTALLAGTDCWISQNTNTNLTCHGN